MASQVDSSVFFSAIIDVDDRCIRIYTSAFDDHDGTWKTYGTSALETTDFVMSAAPHMCLDTDETLKFFVAGVAKHKNWTC